jgi:long-chain fatty acid transport protein
MKPRPLAVLILLSLFGAGRAHGAGFALFEQGVVALGRGGAAVAGPSNPASVFYNPATLAGVHGTRVGITPSVIFFDNSYAGEGPYPGPGAHGETPTKAFPIPAVYLAHELASGLTSGFGLSAPFGLETDWRDSPSFPGRFLSQRARIEQVLASAALGWQANPRVRLGASIGVTSSKVILQRAVTYPIPGQPAAQEVGTATLESGREWGLGGSVGVQFLQTESLRWGALLRAGSAVDFDAAATPAMPVRTR